MLIVKDVKVVECKGNMAEIVYADWRGLGNLPLDPEIKKEIVYGKRFVNEYGEEVLLGLSKQAQDVLGLPFEKFDMMREQISNLQEQHFDDNEFIVDILMLNFWGRLKFAFTKIISDRKRKC